LIALVHLLDDVVGIGGPDKGFGFVVVLEVVRVDRDLEVDERVEDAACRRGRLSEAKKVSTALPRSRRWA
jgi:hypothetical protein